MGFSSTSPTILPPETKSGDIVSGGSIVGEVEENPGIIHRIMVPPNQKGKIAELKSGNFTVNDIIGKLDNGFELRLKHNWPVRVPRPVSSKLKPEAPYRPNVL